MTNKNKRKTNLIRIDNDTLKELQSMKRELSVLENKDLALGEIIKRGLTNDEIKERLRIGARERRLGFR